MNVMAASLVGGIDVHESLRLAYLLLCDVFFLFVCMLLVRSIVVSLHRSRQKRIAFLKHEIFWKGYKKGLVAQDDDTLSIS